MKKNLSAQFVANLSLFFSLVVIPHAWSLDQIVRPYQSARSAGMGGVTLSTGLYDEVFFGNPARVLANPKSRLTLFDLLAEVDTSGISHLNALTSDGDFYSKMSSTAGSNNHVRIQTTAPAFYLAPKEGKMGFALGLIMSTQADVDLRNSYQIDPTVITDIGPALTIGRKFLENNTLGIGLTAHATYRVATNQSFTFLNLIRGQSLTASNLAGQGAHIDADLGATYQLPFEVAGGTFTIAGAANNILGGKYSNLSLKPLSDITGTAPAQPRSYGLGISANFAKLGWLTDSMIAIESRDIGNNPNGGLFRTVHIGGESRFGILLARLGINQGYLTAGLGIDLKLLNIDVTTYGEEMSLNPGGLQDRRYAAKVSLQF